MKILHFYRTSFSDTHGGIEVFLHHLILAGQKVGIDAEVLSLSRDGTTGSDDRLGYRVHRVPRQFELASNSVSFKAISEFRRLSRAADIIHYHFPWPFMDLVHFLTHPKKPTVLTYHSDIVRQKALLKLYRPLMTKFLSSVNRVVTTSENYFSSSDTLQALPVKPHVIPIGIDKNLYPKIDQERVRYWRDKFGSKFFLFVGVLRYYKGLHILIEAAKNTNWPILIVGAGPTESELLEHIRQRGLTNIHILGLLPDEDKVALYHLCHAIVFPSYMRSEAFGVTLVEGAMFGKPMISSEIGTGTSFVNQDGETGFVVKRSDPEALRFAMQRLWEDDALSKQFGEDARLRYEKLFSSETMAKAYRDLYRELI